MPATIKHAELSGCLRVPASKSYSQRALILALLNNGTTIISNIGKSNDENIVLDAILKLGANCSFSDHSLTIKSSGDVSFSGVVNVGESGLAFRMFVPVMSLSKEPVEITGEGSLKKRSIKYLDILSKFGVSVTSNAGLPPVKVKGPFIPVDLKISASDSSQFLTGILFAIAVSAKHKIKLEVENLVSKPYIDISLNILKEFGYVVENYNYQTFYIHPKSSFTNNICIDIESDWSNAAFFLVAGAISGFVEINDINLNSLQGDKAIVDVLKLANAQIICGDKKVKVAKSANLIAFKYDATNTPDLFPPLVILAAFCEGESIIAGVERLVSKESNRANSLIDVFSKMGVEIWIEDNEMHIKGKATFKFSEIDSHNDHRIVMAASIAATASGEAVIISNYEAVNKSYPLFFDHLKQLGGNVLLT